MQFDPVFSNPEFSRFSHISFCCLFLQRVPRAPRLSLPREWLFECRTFVLTRGHPYWSRCGAGATAQGRGMRCVQQRDCMNGIVIVVLTEPHVSIPPVSQHDADCAACRPFSLFAWPPDGLASRPRHVPPSFTYDPELAFALLHTCGCAPRPNVASMCGRRCRFRSGFNFLHGRKSLSIQQVQLAHDAHANARARARWALLLRHSTTYGHAV
jgi:hypothetical protein